MVIHVNFLKGKPVIFNFFYVYSKCSGLMLSSLGFGAQFVFVPVVVVFFF